MVELNDDILFLILKELRYNKGYLYSCLLVNKTWCKIAIPILWKHPWKQYTFNMTWMVLFFDSIISHLSNEAKENLRIQGINLSTSQQKPSFNYISFCRHLNLGALELVIAFYVKMKVKDAKDSMNSILTKEILNLFIKNTRITYLCPTRIDYQMHLIPGAEHCFSELKFLECDNKSQDEFLKGLSKISKSIEKLGLYFTTNKPEEMTGTIKLIEAQKNLNDINIESEELLCEALEDSLIKHANTIQYLKVNIPIKKVLSSLINLKSLDMNLDHKFYKDDFEYAYLPALKILKVKWIYTIKGLENITNMIENTNGDLTEICIGYGDFDNNNFIQAIYQNCPKLRYIRIQVDNNSISKLKELLINCQYLKRLLIVVYKEIDLDNLFEIIAKFSPTSLFRFKFAFLQMEPKLESLKLFFDNWKGRHVMLLEECFNTFNAANLDLIENYKAEGVVKSCFEEI